MNGAFSVFDGPNARDIDPVQPSINSYADGDISILINAL